MKILIVDDHPVMREGIRLCLRDLDSTIDFVEAADLEEAVRAANSSGPFDLVLFDLALPGTSGVQSLIAFRDAVDSCLAIVVFSGSDDAATVTAALDAGAMGFIPKTSTAALLRAALRIVLAHGIYVPPTVLHRGPASASEAPSAAARPLRRLSELGLTARQQKVCALMVKGRALKHIARDLGISLWTVKAHVQPILRTLGAMNRMEAIVALHRLGFSLETDRSDAA
jgi:DNA-binding NarL/FixJ family response regulator